MSLSFQAKLAMFNKPQGAGGERCVAPSDFACLACSSALTISPLTARRPPLPGRGAPPWAPSRQRGECQFPFSRTPKPPRSPRRPCRRPVPAVEGDKPTCDHGAAAAAAAEPQGGADVKPAPTDRETAAAAPAAAPDQASKATPARRGSIGERAKMFEAVQATPPAPGPRPSPSAVPSGASSMAERIQALKAAQAAQAAQSPQSPLASLAHRRQSTGSMQGSAPTGARLFGTPPAASATKPAPVESPAAAAKPTRSVAQAAGETPPSGGSGGAGGAAQGDAGSDGGSDSGQDDAPDGDAAGESIQQRIAQLKRKGSGGAVPLGAAPLGAVLPGMGARGGIAGGARRPVSERIGAGAAATAQAPLTPVRSPRARPARACCRRRLDARAAAELGRHVARQRGVGPPRPRCCCCRRRRRASR